MWDGSTHLNASRCVCEEAWLAQPTALLPGLEAALFYLAGGEGFRGECQGKQEKERWSPRSSAACGYVLACHSKQGRLGYLQHSDGGAGMATEGENAGGSILEANRVKRRSLDAF